jgi:hypothetical protein
MIGSTGAVWVWGGRESLGKTSWGSEVEADAVMLRQKSVELGRVSWADGRACAMVQR